MQSDSPSSIMHLCTALNQAAQTLDTSSSVFKQRKKAALKELTKCGKGIVPSGPRKRGEGCEDEEQGILSAEQTPTGGARLSITLLAAGFIIGPQGISVRDVTRVSGADIRSWSDRQCSRQVRVLVIEGKKKSSVVKALETITAAVDRYKELCEGKYSGQYVDRQQVIKGITFHYSPPPRSAVPFAAALKSDTVESPPLATNKSSSSSSFKPSSTTTRRHSSGSQNNTSFSSSPQYQRNQRNLEDLYNSEDDSKMTSEVSSDADDDDNSDAEHVGGGDDDEQFESEAMTAASVLAKLFPHGSPSSSSSPGFSPVGSRDGGKRRSSGGSVSRFAPSPTTSTVSNINHHHPQQQQQHRHQYNKQEMVAVDTVQDEVAAMSLFANPAATMPVAALFQSPTGAAATSPADSPYLHHNNKTYLNNNNNNNNTATAPPSMFHLQQQQQQYAPFGYNYYKPNVNTTGNPFSSPASTHHHHHQQQHTTATAAAPTSTTTHHYYNNNHTNNMVVPATPMNTPVNTPSSAAAQASQLLNPFYTPSPSPSFTAAAAFAQQQQSGLFSKAVGSGALGYNNNNNNTNNHHSSSMASGGRYSRGGAPVQYQHQQNAGVISAAFDLSTPLFHSPTTTANNNTTASLMMVAPTSTSAASDLEVYTKQAAAAAALLGGQPTAPISFAFHSTTTNNSTAATKAFVTTTAATEEQEPFSTTTAAATITNMLIDDEPVFASSHPHSMHQSNLLSHHHQEQQEQLDTIAASGTNVVVAMPGVDVNNEEVMQACGFPTFSHFARKSPIFRHPAFTWGNTNQGMNME